MRLNINLASQPYEDSRQFWVRWGTALVAACILSLALVAITISGWLAARRDHATMAYYRSEIAERDGIRQNAEAFLNRPENRTTRDESQFLNQLIERKAFSWTLVLEDLEKVMPARVHLVSIHPELDEQNQLTLKMLVAGDSRDKALELARRMEDSRHFTQTYIQSEIYSNSNTGDPVQFAIVATYAPEGAAAAQAAATPAAAPGASAAGAATHAAAIPAAVHPAGVSRSDAVRTSPVSPSPVHPSPAHAAAAPGAANAGTVASKTEISKRSAP
jgi:type IV pilus assembly protein PilN